MSPRGDKPDPLLAWSRRWAKAYSALVEALRAEGVPEEIARHEAAKAATVTTMEEARVRGS